MPGVTVAWRQIPSARPVRGALRVSSALSCPVRCQRTPPGLGECSAVAWRRGLSEPALPLPGLSSSSPAIAGGVTWDGPIAVTSGGIDRVALLCLHLEVISVRKYCPPRLLEGPPEGGFWVWWPRDRPNWVRGQGSRGVCRGRPCSKMLRPRRRHRTPLPHAFHSYFASSKLAPEMGFSPRLPGRIGESGRARAGGRGGSVRRRLLSRLTSECPASAPAGGRAPCAGRWATGLLLAATARRDLCERDIHITPPGESSQR